MRPRPCRNPIIFCKTVTDISGIKIRQITRYDRCHPFFSSVDVNARNCFNSSLKLFS